MCRPARSSADVCQRGTVRQCIGGGNTPCGVRPSPPGGTARLGIGTPRRWHPLSSGPTSAWRQPSLSANLCSRQKLLRASEALTDSSSSTGPHCSPARKIERSQEGTRGGLGGCNLLAPLRNLTMRSCLPRKPAVHCIVMCCDSSPHTLSRWEDGSLCSNLSCRKESTTPIVHLWGSSR